MGILQNKQTRAIIMMMIALSAIVLIFFYFYYKNENNKVDPRIKDARIMYEKYNLAAADNNFINTFLYLDSIDLIYRSVTHYQSSFERGVLLNNKCAAIITIVLIKDSTDASIFPMEYRNLETDSLLILAKQDLQLSFMIYNEWYQIYENKSESEVKEIIRKDFFIDLEHYDVDRKEAFLQHRYEEVTTALLEKNRRLSVNYTNQGMVYRLQGKYEEAILAYKEAMDLWSDNLAAENNINKLMHRPIKEKSTIEKIFPKDREKELEE